MDIGSVLLALALFLIVAAFVARPVIEQAAHRDEAQTTAALDSLIAQREAVLIELRDLDFDHSTGKVSEDDFATQRARLVAKGSEILRALDQVSSSRVTPDDDIERLVRARRKGSPHERLTDGNGKKSAVQPKINTSSASGKLSATTEKTTYLCPECKHPIQFGVKFCSSCGSSITSICPECATPYKLGDKFCAKCGSQLPIAAN